MEKEERYYLTKIDTDPTSIYCHHGTFDESYIPEHSHQKGQFLYTEGGIVYIKTPEQTYYLPSRHYIWIAPGTAHSIHPSTESAIMRNLYFPIDTPTEFTQTTRIYPVNDLLKNLLDYTATLQGDIRSSASEFTIVKAFYLLLQQFSNFALPLYLPLPQDERLKEITNYIALHLHQPLKLPEISKKFGISVRSLSRLFTKQLQMSFIEYLTILRILKALEMLLETNKSVSDICIEVGYHSIPTFSNVFYKMVGLRPAAYRKTKTQIKA